MNIAVFEPTKRCSYGDKSNLRGSIIWHCHAKTI